MNIFTLSTCLSFIFFSFIYTSLSKKDTEHFQGSDKIRLNQGMLAAAEYTNCCTKPKIYENDWINNHRRRISWLNFLTVQPIPEETDVIDCPKHIRNNSDSSSSSIEDCYIVLEVQRPRLTDEQLNFAQINEDKHNVEYEQFAEPIIIEVKINRYLIIKKI